MTTGDTAANQRRFRGLLNDVELANNVLMRKGLRLLVQRFSQDRTREGAWLGHGMADSSCRVQRLMNSQFSLGTERSVGKIKGHKGLGFRRPFH